jgi:dTMP kinase
MARGRLITIEGLDGAGKTTLAAGLAEKLAAEGITSQALREPGGVELSERIRDLVKDPGLTVGGRAEALLYAAARAQLVEEVVEPQLESGTWIVLDRFVHSSLAYQGEGRELGVDAVAAINAFATGGLLPDLVLVLRVDPERGRARLADRGEPLDRLEQAGPEFFARVRAFYDSLEGEAGFATIDADRSPDEVLADAWRAVKELQSG